MDLDAIIENWYAYNIHPITAKSDSDNGKNIGTLMSGFQGLTQGEAITLLQRLNDILGHTVYYEAPVVAQGPAIQYFLQVTGEGGEERGAADIAAYIARFYVQVNQGVIANILEYAGQSQYPTAGRVSHETIPVQNVSIFYYSKDILNGQGGNDTGHTQRRVYVVGFGQHANSGGNSKYTLNKKDIHMPSGTFTLAGIKVVY